MEDAAKRFEALYPGIKIKFESSQTWGTNQWYESEAAGGVLPDVVFVQSQNLNELPTGTFTNLKPYFNQPNPYISGNKQWKDVMNPRALSIETSPNGAQYIDNGDWVGTAFYYNKNLFRKAGIASAPTTWTQLMADCAKLKAHGIQPGAGFPNFGWFAAIFVANALGGQKLAQLQAYTPGTAGYINGNDEVKGYQAGFFNPVKNPAIMAWWPGMKKLYSYWNQDVLNENRSNIAAGTTPTGELTGQSLFLAGKAAIYYTGTWLPSEFGTLPKSQRFPLGSFNLTNLKGSSPYATNLETAQDVGGPSGAWQYAIPSRKADNSLTPQKFKAVMDWVRFFTTPTWDQNIVDEYGADVPTLKGTVPTKANRGTEQDITKPYYQVYPYINLTPEAGVAIPELFQQYVTGHLSFKAAKFEFNADAVAAVQAYMAKYHIK
jgi:raffinose/stachyose/melibiose transport system substrate-binding protein